MPGTYRDDLIESDVELFQQLIGDIQKAVEEHIVCDLVYIDSKGATSQRLVEPTEIKDQAFFAWCRARDGIRRFSIVNVKSFSLTDETFEPRDFSKPKEGTTPEKPSEGAAGDESKDSG